MRIIVPTCLSATLLMSILHADTIFLKNGLTVDGVVTQETDSRVTIRTSGSLLQLPRSTIERIDRENPNANAVLKAAQTLHGGQLAQGVIQLLEAAELEGDKGQLEKALVDNESTLVRAAAEMSSDRRVEARFQVRKLIGAEFLTEPGNVTLARILSELGAEEDAAELLDEVGIDYLRENPRALVWAEQFLRRQIRANADGGQYDKAVGNIERFRLLNPEGAEGQKALVALSESAAARDRDDYERALQIIAQDLWPEVPEVARNRALVTLRQLTTWAEFHQEERNARRWLKTWLVPIMPIESLSASNRLIRSEAARSLNDGDAGWALRLLESVDEDTRTPELNRLLNAAQFEVKQEEVDPDDPIALFELAQWGLEHDLFELSLPVFEQVRQNEQFREIVDEQLSVMRAERDMELLDQAIEAYDKGLLFDVIEISNKIALNPDHETPVQKQAVELAEAARKEIAMEQQRRPYQAEAFYQQAERAHFMDHPQEAWNLIDMILTHYAETPAAERAAALLPSVARQFEIQLLEGRRTQIPDYDVAISEGALQRADMLGEEIRRLLREMEAAEDSNASD
ncbi:hypothetical protein KQI84_01175 [bacterium]|nr:hypothetical protein [bacterium]